MDDDLYRLAKDRPLQTKTGISTNAVFCDVTDGIKQNMTGRRLAALPAAHQNRILKMPDLMKQKTTNNDVIMATAHFCAVFLLNPFYFDNIFCYKGVHYV